MLLAAGAMQYPTKKFLAALAVGRGIRYTILAYLGYRYGHNIMNFFAQYYWPLLFALIACSLAGGLYGCTNTNAAEKPRTPKFPERVPFADALHSALTKFAPLPHTG